MGFLGMQLEGEHFLGLNSVAYGLVELELEAGDSGLALVRLGAERALDVRDPRLRQRRAEGGVAPAHGGRRGDRVLRPVRARLGQRSRQHAHGGASATATTGSCPARRCGSRTAACPTSRSCGPTPTRASGGSSCPTRRAGVQRPGHPQEDVAARLGDVRAGDGRRAAPRRRDPARRPGVEGPAVLPQRGPLRDRVGRDGRGARVLRDRPRVLEDTRAVRQADRRVPADAEEARRHGARVAQGNPAGAAPRVA